ncbi:MAG TPA: hypothetical protein VFZ23_08975 [Pyrinomonadaceae bacterium]
MIDASAVKAILEQYEKHGWELRRALLSSEARTSIGHLFPTIESIDSDFDALWFSRRSKAETEAWELRRLSALPFALVTGVASSASPEERDATLAETENEMRERTLA